MSKTKSLFELFRSKSQSGKDFEDKHVVHTKDDANGNGDEVFKGSKVKPIDRKKTRQGYNPGEDEKVYEELDLEEGYTIKSMGHENVHLFFKGKLVKKFRDPRDAKMYIEKQAKQKDEKDVKESLTEDDIIDAITEMAELEGIDLTEEVFYEMYEALVSELNPKKPTSVRESFIKKYIEPEVKPIQERISEELSYLPSAQVNAILDLYEDLNESNRAILRQNLNNPEVINSFIDFAISNRS